MQQTAAPAQTPSSKKRQTCPSCKALVQDGDIICVVCGTNLLTGQKIGEEMQAQSEQKSRTPLVLAAIAVILLIFILGVSWFYVYRGDPVNRALRLIENGDYFNAETILAEHVDRVPDDERAWVELGRAQWHGNKFAAAARSFETVVGLNSSNTEAAKWAVASLAASGAQGVENRQIAMLSQVVANEPRNEDAKYLLGLAKGASQNVSGQIETMNQMTGLGALARLRDLSLGVALALEGKHSQAQQKLNSQGLSPSASNGSFQVASGFISGLEGDRQAALQRLKASIDAGETAAAQWEALIQYGKLLMEEGRFQEAEPHLRKAMDLRPSRPMGAYLHALCLSAVGSFPAALSEFESILTRQGNFASEAGAQAATIYLSMGNTERASDTITRATSLGRGSASVHTVRGRVMASQGNNRAALDAFSAAKRLDTDYAAAYLESGLAYLRQEMLGQALREFTTYLEKVGEDVAGTRAYEIRTLVNQLYQTTGRSPNQ